MRIEPIEPIQGGQGRSRREIEAGCFFWCPIMAVLWLFVVLIIAKGCGG